MNFLFFSVGRWIGRCVVWGWYAQKAFTKIQMEILWEHGKERLGTVMYWLFFFRLSYWIFYSHRKILQRNGIITSVSQRHNYLKLQFDVSSLEFVWVVIFIFISFIRGEISKEYATTASVKYVAQLSFSLCIQFDTCVHVYDIKYPDTSKILMKCDSQHYHFSFRWKNLTFTN